MDGNFERTASGFRAVGTIVGVQPKSAKGGALILKVECPMIPMLGEAVLERYEKIGVVEFAFQEDQPEFDYGDNSENDNELN